MPRARTEFSDISFVNMPYPEIENVASKPGSVLTVPVGAVEQHGHHLPVGTDMILAEEITFRAASSVSDRIPILSTPSVWPGYSPHHMSFGGTLSTGREHLIDLLTDVVDSVIDTGFDSILFVNGHGGNMSLISSLVSETGAATTGVEILAITYFEFATDVITDLRDSDIGGMAHAGEFETSLMLYLCPHLVSEDEISGKLRETDYELERKDLMQGAPLSVYRPYEEYSPTGAVGDPVKATSEKGERMTEAIVGELGDLLLVVHENTA